jgi:hypothetical protein
MLIVHELAVAVSGAGIKQHAGLGPWAPGLWRDPKDDPAGLAAVVDPSYKGCTPLPAIAVGWRSNRLPMPRSE